MSDFIYFADEIIKGVYDKVSATHDNILALYTAQHASWVSKRFTEHCHVLL